MNRSVFADFASASQRLELLTDVVTQPEPNLRRGQHCTVTVKRLDYFVGVEQEFASVDDVAVSPVDVGRAHNQRHDSRRHIPQRRPVDAAILKRCV